MSVAIYPITSNHNCSMCHLSLSSGKAVTHLGEGPLHPFHIKCIKAWADIHGFPPFCPFCNVLLKIEPEDDLTGFDRLHVSSFRRFVDLSLSDQAKLWGICLLAIGIQTYTTYTFIVSDPNELQNRVAYLFLMTIASTYLLTPSKQLPLQREFCRVFGAERPWLPLGLLTTVSIINFIQLFPKADLLVRLATVGLIAMSIYKKILGNSEQT